MQHHLETENLASRFRRLQSHGNRADPFPPPIGVKAAGELIALHLPDAVKARAGSRSERLTAMP
jgi:hypothetical protein